LKMNDTRYPFHSNAGVKKFAPKPAYLKRTKTEAEEKFEREQRSKFERIRKRMDKAYDERVEAIRKAGAKYLS
jgi:hypothetical protein